MGATRRIAGGHAKVRQLCLDRHFWLGFSPSQLAFLRKVCCYMREDRQLFGRAAQTGDDSGRRLMSRVFLAVRGDWPPQPSSRPETALPLGPRHNRLAGSPKTPCPQRIAARCSPCGRGLVLTSGQAFDQGARDGFRLPWVWPNPGEHHSNQVASHRLYRSSIALDSAAYLGPDASGSSSDIVRSAAWTKTRDSPSALDT
jgi:hypothetical protein